MKAVYVAKGETIDYTASTAVSAGDVIFVGTLCGIAKHDIPAGAVGALAITGVYDMEIASATVVAAGAKLYFASGALTTTANDYLVGTAIAASAAGSTVVRVKVG